MENLKNQVSGIAQELATRPPAEGKWTKRIENQTAKIPSVFFLNLGVGSILLSLALKVLKGRKTTPNFIGLWVPTFLLLGIYNKLVKLEGNDRYSRA